MDATTGKFVKYQGLGNDFILVDNRNALQPKFTSEQAIRLCNRNFGIGADGVIFAMPGQNDCDYTMRIFNSDGSEPQMCGNGIRCLAKFLQRLLGDEAAGEQRTFKIWTNAGVITPTLNTDGSVTVDMGEPILEPGLVPTVLAANTVHNITKNDRGEAESRVVPVVVDTELELPYAMEESFSVGASAGANSSGVRSGTLRSAVVKVTAVGMGNPHAVVFVESLDAMNPPFRQLGPALEAHTAAFPERVNAEFVQVISRSHARMQVWERGAGPTLACGTGACAVVVAGVLTGRLERHCVVTLPGGDLSIHWKEEDNSIYMTGPAQAVFEGTILL